MRALLLCRGNRYDRHASSLAERGIVVHRFDRGEAALEFLSQQTVEIFIAGGHFVLDGPPFMFWERASDLYKASGMKLLMIQEFTEYHPSIENEISVGSNSVAIWMSCSDETFNKALDTLIDL